MGSTILFTAWVFLLWYWATLHDGVYGLVSTLGLSFMVLGGISWWGLWSRFQPGSLLWYRVALPDGVYDLVLALGLFITVLGATSWWGLRACSQPGSLCHGVVINFLSCVAISCIFFFLLCAKICIMSMFSILWFSKVWRHVYRNCGPGDTERLTDIYGWSLATIFCSLFFLQHRIQLKEKNNNNK